MCVMLDGTYALARDGQVVACYQALASSSLGPRRYMACAMHVCVMPHVTCMHRCGAVAGSDRMADAGLAVV